MLNASTGHGGRVDRVRVQDPAGPQLVAYSDAECLSHAAGDADSQAGRMPVGECEELIGFEEAARILGMGERNLRKILQRSRERIEGKWTSGPTIRFFQCQAKSAIKFRRKWLEDFIDEHTHDPSPVSVRQTDVRRRNGKNSKAAGFGHQGRDSEPDLGFDSQLYDL